MEPRDPQELRTLEALTELAEFAEINRQLSADADASTQITVTTCGPSVTGCNHDHDGPEAKAEDGSWVSSSCSKCGSLTIDRTTWEWARKRPLLP